ncbi:MAG: phosphopantetheine-binding protein [Pseudomonadota bacterium]
MKDRESLKRELKEMIIDVLALEDITPEDIEDDAPLFIGGLGLDSIDALELVVALDKSYKVRVDSEEKGRKILRDINSLADFLINQGKE